MDLASAPAAAPAPRIDGRNRRALRSRAACIAACRSFLQTGNYRPTMVEIAKAAGVSTRTGFQLFLDIDLLRQEAVNESTARVIAATVLGSDAILLSDVALKRMVRALLLGKAA